MGDGWSMVCTGLWALDCGLWIVEGGFVLRSGGCIGSVDVDGLYVDALCLPRSPHPTISSPLPNITLSPSTPSTPPTRRESYFIPPSTPPFLSLRSTCPVRGPVWRSSPPSPCTPSSTSWGTGSSASRYVRLSPASQSVTCQSPLSQRVSQLFSHSVKESGSHQLPTHLP